MFEVKNTGMFRRLYTLIFLNCHVFQSSKSKKIKNNCKIIEILTADDFCLILCLIEHLI